MAESAMEELDGNADGLLDANELAKSPGLAAGARHIDRNSDGSVSADELESRFKQLSETKLAIRGRGFRLTYRRRPLAGAHVRFVPEPFLEGVIEPAEGVTDDQGVVHPSAGVEGLGGLRIGYYRVEATSSAIPLPAEFNSQSKLGVDVGLPSDEGDSYGVVELPLMD
jgi:hypothetical protein